LLYIKTLNSLNEGQGLDYYRTITESGKVAGYKMQRVVRRRFLLEAQHLILVYRKK